MIYTFCLGLLLGALIVNIYLKDMEKQRDNAELRAVTHFQKVNDLEKEQVILLENSEELRQKANIYDEIAEIIKSDRFTFDMCNEIKELVDNLENDN